MKKPRQSKPAANSKTQVKQANARADQAEAQVEQAKAREEQAKAREEQAKAREEQAKAQTEQVKARAEQTKTVLQNVLHKSVVLQNEPSPRLLNPSSEKRTTASKNQLEKLTERQREILRLIAEGNNTKQIAESLKVSPKTVEYHRMKLMQGLNLHDIPGLVRFAVREGLVPQES